ncbi:hypothetical protein ACEWY4_002185 [Coilia grayii]|uniref:Myb/SANT-like DNA-binding domain-containing protein n=1 Tax=Coilia grayii TaxID=363190 RepID=A0ABD1KV48_9TELE
MEDHASYSAPSTPAPTNNELTTPLATNPVLNSAYTYKMSEEEILQFVKLRVSNKSLFTGKKNSARLAWRAILKEMGLQGKITALQAKKKWDNLQSKYKNIHEQELKNPPSGVTVIPQCWHRYSLMDDAMQGRLDDSAKKLSITSSTAYDVSDFQPSRPRMKRWRASSEQEIGTAVSSASAVASAAAAMGAAEKNEIELMVDDSDVVWTPVGCPTGQEAEQDRLDIEQERAQLDSDRLMVDREREVLERERILLERERAGLQRELAALDRDRASLERDRATVERERAAVDWERAMLEKERTRLERDRLAMGIEGMASRASCTTLAMNGRTNAGTDGIRPAEVDPECVERRQKFLDLLENLLQKF